MSCDTCCAGEPLVLCGKRLTTLRATLIWANPWRPQGEWYTDGAMTAGSGVLTSSQASFSASDVGRYAIVQGAGTNDGPLISAIASYQSATQVTLASNAVITVSAASFAVYRPVDLTGRTAKLQVKGTDIELTDADGVTLGGVTGQIDLEFAAADLDIEAGDYPFDLAVYLGADTDRPLPGGGLLRLQEVVTV